MIRQVLFLWLLCLCACTTPPAEVPPETREPGATTPVSAASQGIAPTGRLPDVVAPLRYSLDLTIVPERDSFSGHVTIDLDIRKELESFYLHASELRVSESLLRLKNGETIVASFRQTNVAGVAQIVLPRAVAPQTATLQVSYEARFGERLKGLYRVRDGGDAYAFTQFEPISARQAFPCFDEPVFKTPFTVSLSVTPGHAAVTNTPEVQRTPMENGLVRISFAKTAPLPTYLIAFAVGPLDIVTAPDIPSTPQRQKPLPLRGLAAAGKGPRLAHALGTTPELLAELENYFDMAHPYPKLDILAVPEFAAGAMENVGAIMYRENFLLLADDASVLQRRRHALVHAHEMAHMWFGNLVTMPWWDDIWLNEAFATWMAYKTVAAWNPEHRAELSRLSRLDSAMQEDALSTARQIRQPVVTDHDIENAFDGITYSKGGAVLTMFERYMGAERFREAIRNHIGRFQHGNANVDDFIASIAEAGGQDIGDAFGSFLFQPGIPLLEVNLDCSATEPAVIVRQTRFKPIGSEAGASRGWTVPVCLRYGSGDRQFETCSLAGPDTATVSLESAQCPDWLLPNAGFAGYFHWVLPSDAYSGLLNAGKTLAVVEQLSVADSIYAALASGRMSIAEGGSLLAALAESDRPQVALIPAPFIHHTRDYLADRQSTLDGLGEYVQKLYGELPAPRAFDPVYMAELHSDSRRLFLVDVAELRAAAQDSVVRRAAVERAMQWIEGRTDRLAPSSVELALRVLVEDNATAAVGPLLERLRGSSDGQERRTILNALARTTDADRAAEVRNLSLSNDIRINEIRIFLINHTKQRSNRAPTWLWLQQNFDALVQRLPPRDSGRLPTDLTARLCDEAMAREVETFLAPKMAGLIGGPRNLAKTVERIKLCARRAAIQQSQADDYF